MLPPPSVGVEGTTILVCVYITLLPPWLARAPVHLVSRNGMSKGRGARSGNSVYSVVVGDTLCGVLHRVP